MMDNNETCNYKSAPLPACAPLALSYTPLQQSAEPMYDPAEALARGTLFPGLDLPFMNKINRTPGTPTPLSEVMAIDFVTDELGLYLDTHKNDTQAFALLQEFLMLRCEAHKRYTALYGPLCKSDLLGAKNYSWVDTPWPWEYSANVEA